eukprot:scaffold7328_cov314-Pinguiococcus_pyrenoidosus.AAC.58
MHSRPRTAALNSSKFEQVLSRSALCTSASRGSRVALQKARAKPSVCVAPRMDRTMGSLLAKSFISATSPCWSVTPLIITPWHVLKTFSSLALGSPFTRIFSHRRSASFATPRCSYVQPRALMLVIFSRNTSSMST